MKVPFSPEQFFEIFREYNEAVWPMQAVLVLGALTAVTAVVLNCRRSRALACAILGSFWGWAGIGYHLAFFRRINPAAFAFGLLFLVQALVLFRAGWREHAARRAGRGRITKGLGGLLVFYALIVYPWLGSLSGHVYPYSPTFGLPCPTTIFTVGLLMLAGWSVPRHVLAIPLIWATIALYAAFELGVHEDFGLLPAILAGLRLMEPQKLVPNSPWMA